MILRFRLWAFLPGLCPGLVWFGDFVVVHELVFGLLVVDVFFDGEAVLVFEGELFGGGQVADPPLLRFAVDAPDRDGISALVLDQRDGSFVLHEIQFLQSIPGHHVMLARIDHAAEQQASPVAQQKADPFDLVMFHGGEHA